MPRSPTPCETRPSWPVTSGGRWEHSTGRPARRSEPISSTAYSPGIASANSRLGGNDERRRTTDPCTRRRCRGLGRPAGGGPRRSRSAHRADDGIRRPRLDRRGRRHQAVAGRRRARRGNGDRAARDSAAPADHGTRTRRRRSHGTSPCRAAAAADARGRAVGGTDRGGGSAGPRTAGIASRRRDLRRPPGNGAVRRPRRPRRLQAVVALVLGAGNVTGLAPADCISQIFEHGRAAFLKLHPLHAPLRGVLHEALRPLVDAGLLAIVAGGVEVAKAALASPGLDHVHLTGGAAAFDAVVWGGRSRNASPVLAQSMTCELGNVTPWIIVPGRYASHELASQADMIAASIVNNTSFNCIATKLVVTARSWGQRDEFLALVQRRLAMQRPRPAWYPGSAESWESLAGETPPPDGTLPCVLRPGIDPVRDPQFVAREWFVPVAAEVPLEADSVESFCGRVHDLVGRLPGSLAASVTLPPALAAHDAARAEMLVEHLPFGVVAVNTWSALAYSLGSVPWGGFPGATLADPRSGIGFVHDPLLLPLVHNTVLRGPLAARPKPPWFPWHAHGSALAAGLLSMYGEFARGRSGLWQLARMVPAVLTG
ncbi:MAG: aldehyde dehydrogenase family protein [Planctomycetia bacterium]|nr:aldehyde dehydrogenase family protein [Planctomycetia bacterium]